MISKIEIQ